MTTQDRGLSRDSVIDSIVIAVPPDWIRIPLDRSGFESALSASRRRLSSEAAMSKTDRRRLNLIISALRSDLESANVLMLGALIMSVEDDSGSESDVRSPGLVEPVDSEPLSLLLATLSVSVLSRNELGSDVPLTAAVLKVAFDLERQQSADVPNIRVTNIEAPAIVHIPAGDAVRLVQLHSKAQVVGEPMSVFVEQFYVPLDRGGNEAALVLFATPNIEVAEALSGLFESMMETFTILSDTEDGIAREVVGSEESLAVIGIGFGDEEPSD